MGQEGSSRKAYPSDLTDEQWAIVEPLIPPAKQNPRGGRPREVYDAVMIPLMPQGVEHMANTLVLGYQVCDDSIDAARR